MAYVPLHFYVPRRCTCQQGCHREIEPRVLLRTASSFTAEISHGSEVSKRTHGTCAHFVPVPNCLQSRVGQGFQGSGWNCSEKVAVSALLSASAGDCQSNELLSMRSLAEERTAVWPVENKASGDGRQIKLSTKCLKHTWFQALPYKGC